MTALVAHPIGPTAGRSLRRAPSPPRQPPAARNGMSRRDHPDQTSCAAAASAEIGQGPHARDHTSSDLTRSPPQRRRPLDKRGPLQIAGTAVPPLTPPA